MSQIWSFSCLISGITNAFVNRLIILVTDYFIMRPESFKILELYKSFTYLLISGAALWAMLVNLCTGVHFLFVMFLCGVSLSTSIAVSYVYNRSSSIEASLPMPAWVSSLFFLFSAAAQP